MLNSGSAATVWYYRDAQGREVDFIRCAHGTLDLFECKWTESPDDRWCNHLRDMARDLSVGGTHTVGKKTVLCTVPTRITRHGVECVHAAEFFSSE